MIWELVGVQKKACCNGGCMASLELHIYGQCEDLFQVKQIILCCSDSDIEHIFVPSSLSRKIQHNSRGIKPGKSTSS